MLTKPLGTGVLFNASRAGKLPYAELGTLLPSVAGLNAAAMQAALGFKVHACTDVTGFGIVGHAVEMARASGLGFHLDFRRLPFHPQALPMYRKGQTTGSNDANRKAADGFWDAG